MTKSTHRWINETLYKSNSKDAHKMMQDNPDMFSEVSDEATSTLTSIQTISPKYHTGFRHQVHSWPSNPVTHYISSLSAYPSRTVIADLGCGDAAIARDLIPKGFIVLSFDLVSQNSFVVEADICGTLPLPGDGASPDGNTGNTAAQIVDVAVFALSLMGINWPNSIREAWRILKLG